MRSSILLSLIGTGLFATGQPAPPATEDAPAAAETPADMEKRFESLSRRYRESPAIVPGNRFGEDWWKQRHEQKKPLARQGGHDLVFIGDSITQGWEGPGKEIWEKHYAGRKALNLGYSGDRTEHVLWRLMNGELENVDPKLFVIMIGTNNTGHRQDPPEQTADGVKLILELLRDRRPEAKILLLSIFPREEKPDGKLRRINDAINARIKDFADGKHIHWLDIGGKFLAGDGRLSKDIMPDFLHPQAAGYEIWAQAIESRVAELTDTPEVK